MTRTEHMTELNRRLLAHDDYRPGMLFVTSCWRDD